MNFSTRHLAVLLVAAVLAAPASAQDQTLNLSYHGREDSPSGSALLEFADEVWTCTGEAVKINIFPNGQLGKTSDVARGVANGSVAMALLWAGGMDVLNPAFGILSAPLVFNNRRHWEAALLKGANNAVSKVANEAGLRLLGFAGGDQYGVAASQPIVSVADFGGRKIRSPGDSSFVMAALGASPLALNFAEVYTALQVGIVDAAEITANDALQAKVFETTSSFTRTNHRIFTEILIVNRRVFDGLSAQAQACLEQEADTAMEAARLAVAEQENSALSALAKQGMQIVRLVDRRAMYDLANEARSDIVKRRSAAELYASILSSATCPDACSEDACGDDTCELCSYCE